MRDLPPELAPVRRLADLLRDRPQLLVEHWERLARPETFSALRAHVGALVEHIRARLFKDEAETSLPAWEDTSTPFDPPAALAELAHLRRALFDLCEAEGVHLDGEALLAVHAALDGAITTIAGAIAHHATAAARQERERLDLTLRLLPVGVFIADAQGRLLAINDAAMRVWGEDAPLLSSTASYDTYRGYRPGSSEPISAAEWALARALRGEEPPDEELEIVSFGGERRTILNSARALHDAAGRIAGGVAVNVDLTERKRTELRLAAILEGALDAIVLIDAGGRITELNAAAERTFGYTRSQALGRELADLIIEPRLRDAHRRGLQRYLATGRSTIVGRRVEMPAMRADGTILDMELTVVRLPTGGPAVFAGFLRDITDRKNAERERGREAEFRERFIDILGHDLRTPLSAIVFAAHGLHRQEGLTEGAARGLTRILRSADRMERMIHDLLDFSRARHGGGIPVKPAAVDLAATCRHVLDELALTHPGRAMDLRSCGSAEGCWDRDRISQVIQNLVGNALDYSPEGTQVRVAIDGTGDRVALVVNNEGAPIPPEVLPCLFDPFRRGARAAEHASRGLGLGLYIAREIVRAHRGDMTVASDAAAGTTFTVELPRAAALTPP